MNQHNLGLNDLIVTPFFLIMVIFGMYVIGNKIKVKPIRQNFYWGLGIKIASSILFGIIYAFVYDGGDTTMYWRSACVIGDAFYDSPVIWLKLLLHTEPDLETFKYVKQMGWYTTDPASYIPCQVAGFFAPFCFNTYSVMAICFSLISFGGIWSLYKVLIKRYPESHTQISISIFYIPSIFFWGSGLMKDTLTLGALCWFFSNFYNFFILKERKTSYLIFLLISGFIIFKIKIYILLCLFPPVVLWLTFEYKDRIRDRIIRMFITPIILSLGIVIAVIGLYLVSSTSERYNSEEILATAYTTGDYLSRTSQMQGGSYYDLGGVPQSPGDFIALIPAGINVTLFRPYVWEAKNIVMMMAALESAIVLYFTVRNVFSKRFYKIVNIIKNDNYLIFSIVFSCAFAYAIGISTYNFGSLVRYKIPMMPFFISTLFLIHQKISNQKKKKPFLGNMQMPTHAA